ncbi:MAG: DUF6600 domain-containing protein [Nitrospirota bacterium]
MKKIIPVMLLLAALFLIPSYSHPSTLGAVHLSLIEGDVQINTEDTSEWFAAAINMPLKEGDRIWVPGDGRAEIQLNDGTSLRLSEDSSLEILRTEGRSFQFFLNTGHAYVNFRGLRGTFLQLDTPVSSIRSYERGIFRVDVSDDKNTDISVDRGLVYAESKSGSTKVKEGYTLTIRGDDYADLHPLEPSNEWEDWNEERDRALYEPRYSSRYLPDELSPYSYDFERYGRWVYAREYGYVWTPSVVVSVGWAPYRHGRWVWVGGDYVWVSYEPWGWVPYHYGRWISNVSIGWCWVPPVRGSIYWGPGFVGWVYTPDYVAWVPLAPEEIYYGYGYYGRHSVNITNVNITNITVKKVYKNVYVNNAVSVVHRDTFIKGKHVPIKVKENPFVREKISVGRPQIKPEKETAIPAFKEIKSAKLPPSKVREKKIEKLKKERPLVQRKTRSVMRPGSPMKEMPLKSGKGRVPEERKIEKPGKQEQPSERKKGFPEQKSIRPVPSMKGAPLKPEKGKAPVERKMERPPLERKAPEAPPKKEPEKPQKQIVPGERKKEVPEEKKQEEKEMERPGNQGTRMDRWSERPVSYKPQGESKIGRPNERQLMVKREKIQKPTVKQEPLGRRLERPKGNVPFTEKQVRNSDPRNNRPESHYQFDNPLKAKNYFRYQRS